MTTFTKYLTRRSAQALFAAALVAFVISQQSSRSEPGLFRATGLPDPQAIFKRSTGTLPHAISDGKSLPASSPEKALRTLHKGEEKAKAGSSPHNKLAMPLVPPPPPVTPSYLAGPETLGMPFAVEYMGKDELSQKLKEVKLNLLDAQDQLKEKQDSLAEEQDKAQKFGALFDEGVVSKHELDLAKRNAIEQERDSERAKLKVSSLQAQKKSVEDKLAELTKRSAKSFAQPKRKK